MLKVAQNTRVFIISVNVIDTTTKEDNASNYKLLRVVKCGDDPTSEKDFSMLPQDDTTKYTVEVFIDGEAQVDAQFTPIEDADGLIDNYGSVYVRVSDFN